MDSDLYREPRKFSKSEAWIDILLRVNHEETDGIAPGSFITSYGELAKAWRWSKSSVSNFLKYLLTQNMITFRLNDFGTASRTVVTIENWAFYQSKKNGKPNDSGTISEFLPITEKEEKNIYDFDSFWKVYPRKESKTTALKQWNTRIKQGESPDNMIAGARGYAAACQAKGTETKYIKLPSTFIGPDKHYLDHLTTDQPQTNILQQLFPGNSFPQFDD